MPNSFSLYIPITLSTGKEIILPQEIDIKFYGYLIHLKKSSNYYSFLISNFKNEHDAKLFFENFLAYLYWFSTKQNFGIRITPTLSKPTIFSSPISIDQEGNLQHLLKAKNWPVLHGVYDSDKPTIIPKSKTLTTFTSYPPKITDSFNPKTIQGDTVFTTKQFHNLHKVLASKKLKLAIELISQSYFEISVEAKLIRLVTAMEILAEELKVSGKIEDTIDKFKELLKITRQNFKEGSEEYKDCEALLSQINWLKIKSIGQRIRNLIDSYPSISVPSNDISNLHKVINEIYQTRSDLVHEGEAEEKRINYGIYYLKLLLPKILEIKFKKIAEE